MHTWANGESFQEATEETLEENDAEIEGTNKKRVGTKFIIIGNNMLGKMKKNKEMRIISGTSLPIKST
jgi:predicted secreted acid phosphatase